MIRDEWEPTKFAQDFRKWRITKQLTVREVYRLTGLYPSRLSQIENGERRETTADAEKMIKLMETHDG